MHSDGHGDRRVVLNLPSTFPTALELIVVMIDYQLYSLAMPDHKPIPLYDK